MLYKYFTEKLLVLQDVDIEKVEEIDNSIHINCRLKRKPHKSPCCGNLTDKVQDYREQPIKDIPAFGKHIFISVDIVAPVASVFVIVFYISFLTKCKNKR
ncbi:transposase [Ruminococcus sp. NSJ-71]|uniref:Transposase n=1 Tax=Ruminococcus intestinalis TaxID=2763066 RepID=A0ABR7HLU3_9FIRM|nr:transposase [Ruminococcus intestinalis]MBC5728515.1 transposase [Ruminococcus intestinalis]